MSSNTAQGNILRAGIINHSLVLLRALLECGYYSREGLIRGNTVYIRLSGRLSYKSMCKLEVLGYEAKTLQKPKPKGKLNKAVEGLGKI